MRLRCPPRDGEVDGEEEDGEAEEIFLFRLKHVEFSQRLQADGNSKEKLGIHGPISPY